MSAIMSSQPRVPRMQFGLSGGNRTLSSQNMSDIIFLDLSQNLPKALMRVQTKDFKPAGQEWAAIRIQTAFRGF
nr:mediator subunit 8 [Tanacetum cinerariifolium]